MGIFADIPLYSLSKARDSPLEISFLALDKTNLISLSVQWAVTELRESSSHVSVAIKV